MKTGHTENQETLSRGKKKFLTFIKNQSMNQSSSEGLTAIAAI
jgi:hypothetical protein